MIEKYFQAFELFTEEEINEFVQLFTVQKLAKNDFFVKEGQRCSKIAFINSGIFRSYYTSSDGSDITYCFRFPNDLMTPYSSFITGRPSLESMHAISEAEILVVSKDKVEEVVNKSHSWTKFLKVTAEQQYLELENRVFQLQKDTALQRYTSLLENQPEFIQQIPLQYLASYLGVTQRHLSRIRKEIAN